MYLVDKYVDSNKVSLKFGATIGIRTRDLILTMDALYQLSYRGINTPVDCTKIIRGAQTY